MCAVLCCAVTLCAVVIARKRAFIRARAIVRFYKIIIPQPRAPNHESALQLGLFASAATAAAEKNQLYIVVEAHACVEEVRAQMLLCDLC